MSDQYIGEIRTFCGNYAPEEWALCNGQILNINDNNALYSIIGTRFGGDGITTFALPDMRGRIPVHNGAGPGLTNRMLGDKFGSETVTLSSSEMPAHNHTMYSAGANATSKTAINAMLGKTSQVIYSAPDSSMIPLGNSTISTTAGNQPHNNMQPYTCVNFIIALTGLFPQRP